MPGKIALLGRAVRADWAGIRLLPCMRAQVQTHLIVVSHHFEATAPWTSEDASRGGSLKATTADESD